MSASGTLAERGRWLCMFCGLASEQEAKPAHQSQCAERGAHPHAWVREIVIEGDDDMRAAILAASSRRADRVRAALASSLEMTLDPAEVAAAIADVEALLSLGEGEAEAIETTIVRLSAPPVVEVAEVPCPGEIVFGVVGERREPFPHPEEIVIGWRCDTCGLAQPDAWGADFAGRGEVEGGRCHNRGGGVHLYSLRRARAEQAEIEKLWKVTRREIEAEVGGPGEKVGVFVDELRDGRSWEEARELAEGRPLSPDPRVVGEIETLDGDRSSLASAAISPPTPAPRKRGRPPKNKAAEGQGALVAAPVESPRPIAEESMGRVSVVVDPLREAASAAGVGALESRLRQQDADELADTRADEGKVDEALDALAYVREMLSISEGLAGAIEVIEPLLLAERGRLARDVRQLQRRMVAE